MAALWERSAMSTPQVHGAVGQPRGLAYTTILTILQRLHRKGLVSRVESGKLHVYTPVLSREEFAARRGQDLAGILVKLGASGAAAFLVEAERLDPELVQLLRDQLSKPQ